jgi:hypothetical protein
MVSRMEATDAEEVSPSAPEADTFELPETPDMLAVDAMQEAMRSVLPQAEQGDLDPDEDEEPEDELEDESDEYEEPDTDESDEVEGDEPKAKMSAEEWADTLYKDGPQRYSEIPGAMRVEALKKYGERHAQQAVQDSALITRAQLEGQLQWLKWTINVDRQFEDDPDSMLEWLKSGTQEAQAYQQWKAILEREPTPEAKAQSEQSTRLTQLMQKQVGRLQDYPELQQELMQKHRTAPYSSDMDGLERLSDDVAELLVKGVEQSVSKRQEPAKKKAQARVASAKNRAAVPRPDVSRGRTAAKTGSDISSINDPAELFAMGINQVLNKR